MDLANEWVKDLLRGTSWFKTLEHVKSISFMQRSLLKLLGQPGAFQPLVSVPCWGVPSAAWLREVLAQLPPFGPAHRSWAPVGPAQPEAGLQLCPSCGEALGS